MEIVHLGISAINLLSRGKGQNGEKTAIWAFKNVSLAIHPPLEFLFWLTNGEAATLLIFHRAILSES